MAIIKVWAPRADKVDLQIQNTRLSMNRKSGSGWWEIEAALAIHGVDYAFVLNDGNPIPDPRSSWQPGGVFGLSRILDHTQFIWHDQNWQAPPLSAAIIYELHIGTFSVEGTFDGAITHLDFLRDLGVTHIELMPVNGFSGLHGWGYDGVNLYAPHEAYGGPEGLKRLVNACHERGLAVILDVVYNHLGPEGNYLENFGPYFTDRYNSPWGKAVNFDAQQSDEVRRYFCDNALMWLRDYHFDALRIDATHAIHDSSAIHILEQLAREVKELSASLKRHFYLIAESDLNDPRYLHSFDAYGYGIDAQWNDDFHHALHAILTNEKEGYYSDFGSLAHLAKAFNKVFVYDGNYSKFRQRNHGRPVINLSGHHFIAFLQNHDQIGNRAQGDRLTQSVSIQLLQVAAALFIFSPFIPMLFQGEEWGASTPFQYFTDFKDSELKKAVKEGRCREFAAFGWKFEQVPDPQSETTFINSKLNWEEHKQEPHFSLFNWYKKLIHLRKEIHELNDGQFEHVTVSFDEKAKWFMVKRGALVVAANFAQHLQRISCPEFQLKEILLSSNAQNVLLNDTLILQAESVVIFNTKR